MLREPSDGVKMDSIGEYIKSLRVEKNYTIEELAELTLIKVAPLIQLENDDLDALGGFGVAKSYAYSIVRRLDVNETKLTSIIDNKYPEHKVESYVSLGYEEQKKFLISANSIYAVIFIIITTFLVIYVVNIVKDSDLTIFKARSEMKEAEEEEQKPAKIIIELPAPSERER